jgi:anaerobic ribonucleoside-triphosphate reductase activating protein
MAETNYSNIKYFCTTNGSGIRTALFVSGCNLHCKGCFNSKAWDYNFGKPLTDEVIERILKSIEPEYIAGLSILGGEPLSEPNVKAVRHVIESFRERFGNKKDIWLWTGYNVETLNDFQAKTALMCDYIVDGPFKIDEHVIGLKFKGSLNQRILRSDGTIFVDISNEL